MTEILTQNLLNLMEGGEAHLDLEDVLEKVPTHLRNANVEGLPYTIWELLEHIRLAQRDILDYMVNPGYTKKVFPDDYWPKKSCPMNWSKSLREYRKDLNEIKAIISKVDPLSQLPYGKKGHTFLREILILSKHLSYHLGQIVAILRIIGE